MPLVWLGTSYTHILADLGVLVECVEVDLLGTPDALFLDGAVKAALGVARALGLVLGTKVADGPKRRHSHGLAAREVEGENVEVAGVSCACRGESGVELESQVEARQGAVPMHGLHHRLVCVEINRFARK